MNGVMTKTEATRLARKRLANGHFAVGAMDARVRCPRCETHDVLIYGSMGRRPGHGEMVKQVAQGILDCAFNAECEVSR